MRVKKVMIFYLYILFNEFKINVVKKTTGLSKRLLKLKFELNFDSSK